MMPIEILKGLFSEGQDVMDIEPEEPRLDKVLTRKFSARNRGSVRLSLGLFYTRDEWEQRRKELIARRLP